jgi:opacity protein-like surface antigen
MFAKSIEPYIGLGVGFTGIFADVDTPTGHIKDTSFELTWQLMLGLNIPLNDRIDVNFGFKYINYSSMNHTRSNTVVAETDIDATEFYIGGVYKFGL